MQIDHVRMPWLDHVQFNQSFAEPKFGSSSLAAEVVELTIDTAQLDMRFVATERTGGLRLDCEFRTELFDRESVKLLLEGFAGVLEAVAPQPRTPGCGLCRSAANAGTSEGGSEAPETRIAEGSADFRLMSRDAVEALRQLPEYDRFYRGMVQWIGFSSVVLPFVPEKRIAGKSKYTLRKMLRLAGDGMFSFSLAPLRLGLLIGGVFLLLAGAEIAYVLSFWFRGAATKLVPGWSPLIVVITVSSGISMFLTGIRGIDVGMIFQEVKRRPLYLVKGWTRDGERVASPASRELSKDVAATERRDAGE